MEILFAQTNAPGGSGFAAFLPMILIGLIFYFLILRPQTKQKKIHELELSNMKVGDKVITRGGILGKIIDITGKNKQRIIIKTDKETRLTVSKSYLTLDKNK